MRHTPTHRRHAQGFSVIELLVTMALIGTLITITFPILSALTGGSRTEAGLNIVGMSSDVARQWVEAVAWADDNISDNNNPDGERYNGTAALYCPTGEIRIVSNNRFARSTGGDLLENLGNTINGYRDLPQVEYIQIPNGVGIAGVHRDGTGSNDARFIAPPFAVAFNEFGQLTYGDNGFIYYDGNTNGRFGLTDDRGGDYDPSAWTADSNNAEPVSGGVIRRLPFEAIECVPGIVVFDLDEFQTAGFSFDGGGEIDPGDGDAWDWLVENGRTIFISPHTGVALRDEE